MGVDLLIESYEIEGMEGIDLELGPERCLFEEVVFPQPKIGIDFSQKSMKRIWITVGVAGLEIAIFELNFTV